MTVPGAGAAPPGRAPGAARSPLSDGEWHRMHPLTPLFRGGLVLVVVAGIVISNLRERIIDFFLRTAVPDVPDFEQDSGDPVDFIVSHNLVLLALVAVLGVVLVLIGLFYLAWRFHTFRITGDDVEVRQGVLFRSHRRAPLDRVQGVNLTRPMLARLCGMAKLEVVGAGADANVKLEYLSTSNAEAVRADILRLASGRRLAEAQARDATATPGSRVAAAASVVTEAMTDLVLGAEDPVAEPESVVAIPVARLMLARVLGGGTLVLLVLVVVAVWGSIVGTPWILFTIVPMFLGFGAVLVRSVTKSLRYAIAPTPDGVRITYGLFTTVTEILPPGRIHAVEVSQPLLWRPAGWWAVRVNRMSGRSASSGESDQFAEVLPVGDRADVERVLRLLLPAMPDGQWPLVFEHGILGPVAGDPYTNTPKRAWPLHPLSWRRNGFQLSAPALFLRRGVVWRTLGIFPLARLQSMGLTQGPLSRALRVATVHAHTITGRVSGRLRAVDRDAAVALFTQAEAAAIAAGAADRTHRWAGEGMPVAAPPAEAGPDGGAS
ncbi:PH domain-containing protein [Microbacterium luticocti]|uniref:PH domain-containing protein n=1 Tax=Microbacterium luticocti TaxID=451764 RepID=UPI000405EEF7|nr:PH domain-containing protein [Microbacterium luticocti]